MTLYAVRKRRGQWTICSDENVVLQFENYDEAILTARGAVEVLGACSGHDEGYTAARLLRAQSSKNALPLPGEALS